MSASITFNPYAQGSARGTFGILSEGYIQGLSYDDPIHRYDLVNGILASTETLPMWGGVGIYEDLPAAGAGSTTPNASLGTVVGRATTLTPYTQGVLGGFSVLDYNFAAIQTPQSQVPLSGSNGQVNFYRIGSKKRIAVQIDSTFAATLLGGPTYPELAWDFTNQKLIAFTTGTALQVRVVEINIGNSMVVSYNSGTGAATWVYNGSAAIIELV